MQHFAPISGVASFEDKYIATAGYDNLVILWDAATRKSIARSNHDHLANMCVFSPDGSLLATASSDHTARIWEIPSLKLLAVLAGHSDDVEMVAFSPEGSRVATCSRDHRISVYDVSGRKLAKCIGHEADVISVGWLPGGLELVSSSDDGTIRRWSASSGSELSKVDLQEVETDTLVITNTGQVFAGDDEGRISLINDGQVVNTTHAHNSGIKRLVYSPTSDRLVSLSYDRTMKVWRIAGNDLEMVGSAELPNVVWPRSCAFIGTDRLALATFGSVYATYDLATGQWEISDYSPSSSMNAAIEFHGSLYSVGDSGIVYCDGAPISDMGGLCNFICSVGTCLVTGGQMGQIKDALSGETVFTHRSPLNCAAAYVLDGNFYVAVGSYTGEVIILKNLHGRLVFVGTSTVHSNAIKGLASDGNTLFAVSANRSAALLDCRSLAEINRWEDSHTQIANGCANVGPGVYCSVSRDRILRLWKNGEVEKVPSPHKNSSKCIAVNGDLIAMGDYAGRIAVYSLSHQTWMHMVRPTTTGISSISPRLRRNAFYASAYDGRVYEVLVEGAEVTWSVAVDRHAN